MANKAMRNARRSIRQFIRADQADIMGDYKATGSQLGAISANLRTAGAGIGANLTKAQAQQLKAISRNTASGLRGGRRELRRTGKQMTRDYGSAIGGATGQSALATSRAILKGTKVTRDKTLKATGLLAQGGQLALGIQRSGAKEAASAAEYARNVALKSRFQTSAAQVAEMQFDLEKMGIEQEYNRQNMLLEARLAKEQSQFEFENQLSLLNREEEKAAEEERAAYGQVYSSAGQISGFMSTLPGGQRNNARSILQAWVDSTGITMETNPAAYQIAQETANNMAIGMDANTATKTAIASLYGSQEGFSVDEANTSVQTGTRGAHMSYISDTLQKIAQGEDLPEGGWEKLIVLMRGYEEYAPFAEQINAMTQAPDIHEWGINAKKTSDEQIEEAIRRYLGQR